MGRRPPSIDLPGPGQQRRRFLEKGLLGSALLALGGAGWLFSRGSRLLPPPASPLSTLNLREYSVLHAIAARLVVPMAGFPTVEEVKVAFNADQILARVDPDATRELLQLINLFENALAQLAFGPRVRPFTQLGPDEQDAVLREWQDSRWEVRRTGFQALRSLLLAAYYGSPLTWKAIGYPGPPQGFHQPDAPVWRGGAPR